MGIDTDPVIGALNTSLNLRLLQQNIISSNIANADTPNYKAQVVDFETAFRNALESDQQKLPQATHPNHLRHQMTDPVFPRVYEDPSGVESLNGNTVNRAHEMAKLAENQILYDTSAEILKRKLNLMKYVISEGGGSH